MPWSMRKMHRFTSSCTCAKSHPGVCSPLKHSTVCRERRPRSDCVDAQADPGLRCPHLPVFAWRGPCNVPSYCSANMLHVTCTVSILSFTNHKPYHTCSKIWTFLLQVDVSTTCWMRSKQSTPWSDAALYGIWSGSTLFALACLS